MLLELGSLVSTRWQERGVSRLQTGADHSLSPHKDSAWQGGAAPLLGYLLLLLLALGGVIGVLCQPERIKSAGLRRLHC